MVFGTKTNLGAFYNARGGAIGKIYHGNGQRAYFFYSGLNRTAGWHATTNWNGTSIGGVYHGLEQNFFGYWASGISGFVGYIERNISCFF